MLYYISLNKNKTQKYNEVNINNQENNDKLIYNDKTVITLENKDTNKFFIICLFYVIFLE